MWSIEVIFDHLRSYVGSSMVIKDRSSLDSSIRDSISLYLPGTKLRGHLWSFEVICGQLMSCLWSFEVDCDHLRSYVRSNMVIKDHLRSCKVI